MNKSGLNGCGFLITKRSGFFIKNPYVKSMFYIVNTKKMEMKFLKRHTKIKVLENDCIKIKNVLEKIKKDEKINFNLNKGGELAKKYSKQLNIRSLGFKKYNFNNPKKEINKIKNKTLFNKDKVLSNYVGCLVLATKMELKNYFLKNKENKTLSKIKH